MIEAVKSQKPLRPDMHILVMTRIMPGHSLGGMQKQTLDLCTGFTNLGHQVSVVTTARPDGVEFETIDNVEIFYLSGSRPGYYSRKWNSLCRQKITELHQQKPIAVIHSQSMGAIGVLKWAKKNSIPIVSTWHGTSLTEISTFFSSASYHPRYWHWLLIMPFTLLKRYLTMDLAVRKASSKITLVSPTLEKNMKLLTNGKVITIPNGISLPSIKSKPKSKPLQCLAIGRMEKEKGIHFAIQAIANLPKNQQKNVLLNVVGEGNYLPRLRQIAADLGVGEVVIFHGRADDNLLNEIYHQSRIHLMPTTRQEGLPLTILEGMAYGLATIASDIGGIPGVITNDVDGILVRPNNQQELNQAFELLLSNEQLIDSVGKSARQTIQQRYSKQRMVEETLEVLHRTVQN